MKAFRSLVILISFLTIFSAALAVPPITLEIEGLDDTIASDESSTFFLSINNNQDFSDAFYVTAPRSQWDISFENYYLQIGPGQTKTTVVRVTPPLTVPVGKYGIYFEVKSGSDPSIMEYRYVHINVDETLAPPPVIETELPEPITELTVTEGEATETFFKKSYSVLLENTGETVIEDSWEATFTELETLLLTSEPEKSMVSDYGDRKRVAWTYVLSPGESLTISYVVSYYPILIALGLIGLALIIFGFYYSSAFKLSKTLTKSKVNDKVLRVEIVVTNKTRRVKRGVVIEDYIPVPFDIVKQFDTIEPDSITKHGSYLKVKWKMPEIAPKEERILSYSIKSRLKVVGTITLPQALLTYKRGKGKSTAYSGALNVVGKDIS